MCNAWNHPPSCTCGWGGDGHLGRRSSAESSLFNKFSYVPPISSAYESYVNPNALCPVCKEQVFFYQSPDGGRVFFDELGPPWPKHQCTDNSSVPIRIENNELIKETAYKWQENGWKPFHITGSKIVDRNSIRISGITDGSEFGIYIERSEAGVEIKIGPKCLAQIKEPLII